MEQPIWSNITEYDQLCFYSITLLADLKFAKYFLFAQKFLHHRRHVNTTLYPCMSYHIYDTRIYLVYDVICIPPYSIIHNDTATRVSLYIVIPQSLREKTSADSRLFLGTPFHHQLYLNNSVALCMLRGIRNFFKRSMDHFVKPF